MRNIVNPYTHMEGYNCFGCSPKNENGLQMQFVEDGDFVTCEWEPRGFLQSYHDILHGGIQAALMDEIAAWLVQIKCKTAGVTSNMNLRLKKAVPINDGKLKLKAWLKEERRNLVDVNVELINPDGNLAAKGVITYFTYPVEIARDKLRLPDYEEFFEKK